MWQASFNSYLSVGNYGYKILPILCTQLSYHHLKCRRLSTECASRTGYFWHYALLPIGLGLHFVRKLFAYSSILYRHSPSHDFLPCESCSLI